MKINGLIEVIQTMVLQSLSIARSRLQAPPENEIFIKVLNDMIEHSSIHPIQLRTLIRSGDVMLGGNARLKIYGTLACSSGKRMKKENRVFFKYEEEAIQVGYRPCGHCLSKKYLLWRRR